MVKQKTLLILIFEFKKENMARSRQKRNAPESDDEFRAKKRQVREEFPLRSCWKVSWNVNVIENSTKIFIESTFIGGFYTASSQDARNSEKRPNK